MRSICFIVSVFLVLSCNRTNRLSENDYKWMPYTGNEKLVFHSNTGKEDTIFLLKKDTLIGGAESYSLSPILYEVVSVFAKYTNHTKGVAHYFETHLFQINKGKGKRAELEILFSAADATFYRLSKISIDSLDNEKPAMLQTGNDNYNDVYVFIGEDYLGYGKRSDFITKIYWSKSKGLVRYDKKDSVYWELVKKW